MKRTQIMLPEDLQKQLKLMAVEEGSSMGEMIRRLIQEALYARETNNRDIHS
jgi:metal-responsive CopG/Arc/MetJ family transcriptional regulator